MTTWTPVTKQDETWTDQATPRVFSPAIFSHGSYSGEYVFSMNPRSGVWNADQSTAETWTVQA